MRTDRLDGLDVALVDMIRTDVARGQELNGSTDLLLTGLVDSVGVLRIVTWMEDYLETEIDPIDVVLENFQTVDLMVAYARRR